MTVLGLVSLIVSIVALGVALHAESLAGDAKWKADEALSVAGCVDSGRYWRVVAAGAGAGVRPVRVAGRSRACGRLAWG